MSNGTVGCYSAKNKRSSKQAPCDHAALRAGKHTQCCEPGDICLTNGLCREETVNSITNYAWRFGCTDPEFKDPACAIEYCDAKPFVNQKVQKLVWKCEEDQLWCCNTGDVGPQENRANRTNMTCCDKPDLQFKAENPKPFATASWFGSAFMTGDFSTTTLLPTGFGNSSTGAPASRPSATAIGVGAGVGLFAAISLVVGGLFLWRRKKRSSQKRSERSASPLPVKELSDGGVAEAGDHHRAEMVGMEYRRELGSPVSPVELWSPMSPVERSELPAEEKGRLVLNEADGRPRDHV